MWKEAAKKKNTFLKRKIMYYDDGTRSISQILITLKSQYYLNNTDSTKQTKTVDNSTRKTVSFFFAPTQIFD